jgi:adenylosuccinate lyase/3-carboxy-cis,cis-muconate cycloisomerase
MPTTLDCDLLRDLYGTDELRGVFDSRALVQAWLDVEVALAYAEAEVGVIPESAAKRIELEAVVEKYDLAALRAEIETTKHPLVPLIRTLVERCSDEGGWVHWGATTQDIIDTALSLQLRAALGPILRDLGRATRAAAELARRYARTPMAGRTHGQHAVPITFGLKAATWADELDRCSARLEAAAEGAGTTQLWGAAGTFATLGADAAAVQKAFARRLGLAYAHVHWHATRDRLRDLCHALDEIASAGERVAAEIVRLQATEIAELAEPAGEGHVGSSTMPQKRNPMTCEYVIATAHLLRAATSAVSRAPAHAYERDMGYWAIEWLALPQSLILCGGLLDKLALVLEGLQIDPVRMRANLDLTEGQIMAEAVMMNLGRAIGHEQAHHLVHQAVRRCIQEGRTLAEVLADHPELSQHLTRQELDAIMDPFSYLGIAEESAEAVSQKILARGDRTLADRP